MAQPFSHDVSDPLIRAERLCVRLGGRLIVDGVDMAIAPGEIVTLIGLNGAGKSTLVRALLGLVAPTSGRVRRRAGLKIGYTPQHVARDETLPLTVARFLTLGVRAPAQRIKSALAEVGVHGIEAAPFASISGGELHRVLLARALLRDPDLLVLDEPIAGVDVAGQAELYGLISDLRDRRGVSVLLVSHDLHLVMARADKVVCLNNHVCCTGSAASVVQSPEFVRLFGARVADELAVYVHHHDHAHDVHGDVVPPSSREDDHA